MLKHSTISSYLKLPYSFDELLLVILKFFTLKGFIHC